MFTTPPTLTRRSVLAAGVGLIAAACSSSEEDGAAVAEPSPTTANSTSPTTTPETTTTQPAVVLVDAPSFTGADPFSLGVASGDPDPSSVVLWTRLIGEGLADVQAVALDIARDDTFTDLLDSRLVDAPATHGHSVHHLATGLPADDWCWYRFRLGDHTSTAGRARTTPEAGSTTPLRFAFSSCQNWESGAYGAHRLLAETDHDLFVWLGDYIYEYGPGNTDLVTSTGLRIHDRPEVTDLDGYRSRYALYRSDPHLQAHHAARPWIVTWDDHEVDNNHAGVATEDDQDPTAFLARKAAAHQAWWEHMPVRLDPPGPDGFDIHRTVSWGDLVDLHMLDSRQHRDPQPTDGEPIVLPGIGDLGVRTMGPTALDPNHSMLGADQEAWLQAQLAGSTARWNVLGNQVFMHGLNGFPSATPATNPDTWDGYAGARRVMLEGAVAAGVRNLVVLSGDFHSSTVGDVRPDPFDPSGPVVATEFMAPAISSQFPAQLRELAPLALSINPQIRWFNPANGWMSCDVDEDTWTTEAVLLADVTDEATTAVVEATITVVDGTPGAAEIVERPA